MSARRSESASARNREATFEYWATIAFAVFILLINSGSQEHQLTRYATVTFVLIHAHGRRIMAEIRNRNTPEPTG